MLGTLVLVALILLLLELAADLALQPDRGATARPAASA